MQYTTKCDIWSLGVICYEMLFGYPPWKARDENELLKGIKTISISHILKRTSLSPRITDFLKKTLAYGEEERIGWNDLFDMFIPKAQEKVEPNSGELVRVQSGKERTRLVSNGNNSWSQQQLNPQNTPLNSNTNNTSNSFSTRQIINPSQNSINQNIISQNINHNVNIKSESGS